MTNVCQGAFARSLPNAAVVVGGAISWCGSNAVNSWSLNQAGNFTTSVVSAITPGSGALLSETVGGNATSPAGVSHIGTITNQASTFVTDPAGFVVTGSGTFVTEPVGFVVTGSGTLEEARDWTSAARLYKAPLSSSEPLIPQWELHNEYRELGEILREMAKLDEDDDLWVEEPVLDIALSVSVRLMENAYPVPQIFTHGPKSLVFTWADEDATNFYLTVSTRNVSMLVSTPEKIKRRVVSTVGEFLKHEHALPLLQLAYSEQQATITESGSSE